MAFGRYSLAVAATPSRRRGDGVGVVASGRTKGRRETNLDVVVDLLDGLGLLDLPSRNPRVLAELPQIFEREAQASIECFIILELLELLEVGLHEFRRLFLVQRGGI